MGPEAPPTPEELERARELVRRHFGYADLRDGQAEILARAFRGEDVLGILPTGGGKSLCYQLPGLLGEGVTLVVSPLIALMKDQLDGLPAPMRAASVAVTSELSRAEIRTLEREIAEGHYRLVYAAPERLRQAAFLHALRRGGVRRFVIDEAHCVSMWGHDFRPDYLGLPTVREALGRPQLLALTATASPEIEREICARFPGLRVVRASVHRPNLRFEGVFCRDADEKLAHLVALCKEAAGPAIVYASSRAKCEQIATALRQAGLSADHYHAGELDRPERQDAFMRGDVQVLVATTAFGMGVDKGDVRLLVHHDPPGSVEAYYQEAGRAGRDGEPARCVLLGTASDGGQLTTRAKQDLPSASLVDYVADMLQTAAWEDGSVVLRTEDLAALDDDDVKPRVAASILEQAGFVERQPDLPRAFLLTQAEGALADWKHKPLTAFDLADPLGVPPGEVEARLLELQEAGDVRFRAEGRDLHFRVTGDRSRVRKVLADYEARAKARGREVMEYVKLDGCRHAFLRKHFGEEAPARCDACDNCLGIRHEPDEGAAPDDRDAMRTILSALSGIRGLGEANLVWFLRGDTRAAPWLDDRPERGALGFRSESRVRRLVTRLEEEGLLDRRKLDHGGTMLLLSAKGRQALDRDDLPVPEAPRRSRGAARASGAEEDEGEADPGVFEALRRWRAEVASEAGMPPYVIAHDRTLRAIAARRPDTLDALAAVPGIGPAKLEKYGEALLEVLREHA